MSDELPPHAIQSALKWREEQAKHRAKPEPEPKARRTRSATVEMLAEELDRNPLTQGLVANNSFARRTMLMKPVPGPDLLTEEKYFQPRQLEDTDVTTLQIFLEREVGLRKLSQTMLFAVLLWQAKRNTYSPPADYFRQLVWDNVERLDDFFLAYAGVELEGDSGFDKQDHAAYVRAVTRCFFISIVAHTIEPGCKVDTALVLEGDQGARKSTLLRKLAIRDEWFSDSLPHDLSSKDARDHLAGTLIVELAEISQLKRSEIEAVKSFLSCQFDRYRPSYGRLTVDWPRQNVFVGTTNDSDHYLRDTTGNRRFWPLKCGEIDIAGAELAIAQVYAEAAAAYWAGEQWWLGNGVELHAAKVQEGRLERDPWHDHVERLVSGAMPDSDGYRWLKTEQVLEALEVPEAQRTRLHEMRVSTILKQLGGKRCRGHEGSNRPWKYRF